MSVFVANDDVVHIFHREYGIGTIERKVTRRTAMVRWESGGSTIEPTQNLEIVKPAETKENTNG